MDEFVLQGWPVCFLIFVVVPKEGFMERGALGHLSFWGPTQV